MKKSLFLCAAFAVAAFAPALRAQDSAPAKSGRVHDYTLEQISVIDKLLAIEGTIGPRMRPARTMEDQWINDYEALYQKFMRNGQLSALPGGGQNEVVDALALGIKASDAVIALKARNVEALNRSAEQIEQLALKLGATNRELGMAQTVKRYASEGRWLDAFMALGFLQRSVLNYLREHPDKKPQATLVIVGGWLQGGRCVTNVIDRNYDGDVSNILREPKLVDLIKKNVDELPVPYINDPLVVKVSGLLPEIRKRVCVGFHEAVKQEDVKWLYSTFDSLVVEITAGPAKKAEAVPEAPKAK